MKKILISFLFFFVPFCAFAQCNTSTKEKVDNLKGNIPYPEYSLNDILYIAFITNEYADSHNFQDRDISVKRVKIVNMMLSNGVNYKSSSRDRGLFVGAFGGDNLEWFYQFVDANISSPRMGDFSEKLYDEKRFSKTREGAIQKLREE